MADSSTEEQKLSEWSPSLREVLQEVLQVQRELRDLALAALGIEDVRAAVKGMLEAQRALLSDPFVTQSQLTATLASLRADFVRTAEQLESIDRRLKNAGLDNGHADELYDLLKAREMRADFYAYVQGFFSGWKGKAIGAVVGTAVVTTTGILMTLVLRAVGIH